MKNNVKVIKIFKICDEHNKFYDIYQTIQIVIDVQTL